MAIGVWAWTEKDTFNNLSLLTNIALDPAFIFIWAGAITFLIGFTGCVGALRENTALLAAYSIFLALLLVLELTAGILGFIFKDWVSFPFHLIIYCCTTFRDITQVYNYFIALYSSIDILSSSWLLLKCLTSPASLSKMAVHILHR